MIASLRGTLAAVEPVGEAGAALVVDVGGVGYALSVPTRLAAQLGPIGSEVTLAVHTYVREGALSLYGFADPLERRCFDLLVGTHGVGPTLALAVLGTFTPAALSAAIAAGDLDALVAVPGVGRKTAQRLVVELANRLELLAPPMPGAPAAASDHAAVREALGSLGYGAEEVAGVLERLPEAGSLEELLRAALGLLAPQR